MLVMAQFRILVKVRSITPPTAGAMPPRHSPNSGSYWKHVKLKKFVGTLLVSTNSLNTEGWFPLVETLPVKTSLGM